MISKIHAISSRAIRAIREKFNNIFEFLSAKSRSDSVTPITLISIIKYSEEHTIAEAIEHLRKDCSSYSKILIFYIIISIFTMTSTEKMSDRSVLFGDHLQFPTLNVDVPVGVILTIFPAIMVFLFIALGRSVVRIEQVAQHLLLHMGAGTAGGRGASIDFGMSMPSVLMPPAYHLQSPLDRLFASIILHAPVFLVLVSTSLKLSAFGAHLSQGFLVALMMVYLFASYWLQASKGGPKRLTSMAILAALSVFVAVVVTFGLAHSWLRGGLDVSNDDQTVIGRLTNVLIRHGNFANEVLIAPMAVRDSVNLERFVGCYGAAKIDESEEVSQLRYDRLHRSDFSGSFISGMSFIDTDLSGASFRGSTLQDVDFRRVNLDGADFTGACLVNVRFSEQASLRAADFTASKLAQSQFRSVDLTEATFAEVTLDDVSFHNVSARRAIFINSLWNKVDFMNSEARGADFTSSLMLQMRMEGVNLAGAQWNFANLIDVLFRQSDFTSTRWSNNIMRRVRLIDGNMSEAQFMGVSAKDIVIEPSTAVRTCLQFDRAEGVSIIMPRDTGSVFEPRESSEDQRRWDDFFVHESGRHRAMLANRFNSVEEFAPLLAVVASSTSNDIVLESYGNHITADAGRQFYLGTGGGTASNGCGIRGG